MKYFESLRNLRGEFEGKVVESPRIQTIWNQLLQNDELQADEREKYTDLVLVRF